jgi:hypothetical protein
MVSLLGFFFPGFGQAIGRRWYLVAILRVQNPLFAPYESDVFSVNGPREPALNGIGFINFGNKKHGIEPKWTNLSRHIQRIHTIIPVCKRSYSFSGNFNFLVRINPKIAIPVASAVEREYQPEKAQVILRSDSLRSGAGSRPNLLKRPGQRVLLP